jgi:hypothetical protein
VLRGRWGAVGPAAAAALTLGVVVAALAGTAAADLRVRGNRLVDGPGRGHAVQLRGVSRSGLEYACIEGWGYFDSPHPDRVDTPAMIAAMKSWDINVVRVPLNEDCWLGLSTPAGRGGRPYQKIVQRYVRALGDAGLYVLLDLHRAAPRARRAQGLLRMADADHAPAFWRSVARTFKTDHAVIFDLYNEPNHISWGCWEHGCTIPAYDDGYGPVPSYRAVGMQQLVNAVRSTGATQPLMLSGTSYAHDVSQWLSHEPRDPLHALVASNHNYGGLSPCEAGCQSAILAVHQRVPVELGEMGETDCAHGYIDSTMAWADAHGIGYVGWAWDAVAPHSWTCGGGPALITSYDGTPTQYGIGLRDHLQGLGVPARPARG